MKSIMKWLAIVTVLGVFACSAYADESYRIRLASTSKIGNLEFKPGEYKLVIDAPKVRLTEVNGGTEVELTAKIEEAAEKHPRTSIHSKRVDGISQITEIRIGGSKTKVAFD